MTGRRRQLSLNAFIYPSGHHEAAWRHPRAAPERIYDVAYYQEIGRTAEAAKFDAVFFADGPALRTNVRHNAVSGLEPITLLTAIATATTHLGLIATASTTYYEPYNLARLFSPLDHISGAARAGTSSPPAPISPRRISAWTRIPPRRTLRAGQGIRRRGDRAVGQLGRRRDRARPGQRVSTPTPDKIHRDRLRRRIPQGAWAFQRATHAAGPSGARAGRRVQRRTRFRGQVRRGHLHRAPDGSATHRPSTPISRRQAAGVRSRPRPDQDPARHQPVHRRHRGGGQEAGARVQRTHRSRLRPQAVGVASRARVCAICRWTGRFPVELFSDAGDVTDNGRSRLQVVAGIVERERPTVRGLLHRLAGARGHRVFAGTPEQVADTIEEWFRNGAADGFNVMPPFYPGGLEVFAGTVVPILQRGLFRTEYTGTTLRDHFGLPRPASQFSQAVAAATP